jgi:hypothetical protein
MKYIFLILLFSTLAFARGTSVKGYTKKNGTYVQPHRKSSANSTKLDNYSYQGNVNPYNGKKGYKK